MVIDSRKWRLEHMLAHLKEKRGQVERTCDEVYAAILDGLKDPEFSLPIEVWAKIDLHLPKAVREELKHLFEEKDRSAPTTKHHLYSIQLAMNAALARIDRDIEAIAAVDVLALRLNLCRLTSARADGAESEEGAQ